VRLRRAVFLRVRTSVPCIAAEAIVSLRWDDGPEDTLRETVVCREAGGEREEEEVDFGFGVVLDQLL